MAGCRLQAGTDFGTIKNKRTALKKKQVSNVRNERNARLPVPTQNTQRGRSRVQHLRDREADIERPKKWAPGHLRRSKGEARRVVLCLGCVFVQRWRKRRMARLERPSRCFGGGSFAEERRSSGDARRAE